MPSQISEETIKAKVASDYIREIKGAFYTPEIWVRLSQKYLMETFGENFQKEYYIWDCAAGTGNLLHGLANKYNVWASTLDAQDVAVMHDRINSKNLNLLEEHCFQFDFLNDSFEKLPKNLRAIVENPKKREKLIIYINPPYAEAGQSRSMSGTGKHKSGVATKEEINKKHKEEIGNASNEKFALFLARIYSEIASCKIAEFSTLKTLLAPNFAKFREYFKAKLEKGFVVPSFSFDNVDGEFPIGFKIWNTAKKEVFKKARMNVYDENGRKIQVKKMAARKNQEYINDWLRLYFDKKNASIGILYNNKNDFQTCRQVRIDSVDTKDHSTPITKKNLIIACIYFAARHCVEETWINNRDQFFYPNETWKGDRKFYGDCLVFTLFHGQNRISSKHGINHWIPFIEWDVEARNNFDSHFMSDFIAGKEVFQVCEPSKSLFGETESEKLGKPVFGAQAKKVLKAGQELYKYYHQQKNANPNAGFYDIREHFQGTKNGRMNSRSSDEKYNELLKKLRAEMDLLSKEIEPKIYEYGFLEE
jgi:hypothetical protein